MTLQSAICAVIAAVCFAAGWVVEGWRMDGQIADIKRSQSEIERKAAEDNAADLTLAIERGDRLVERLAAAEISRDLITQEKEDALRRLTTGRRCLDSAAVRVLNGTLPPGIKAGDVPQAAGQSLPADAAFATDQDVGLWIAQCQRSYDTCRGRIQAIYDFYGDEGEAD